MHSGTGHDIQAEQEQAHNFKIKILTSYVELVFLYQAIDFSPGATRACLATVPNVHLFLHPKCGKQIPLLTSKLLSINNVNSELQAKQSHWDGQHIYTSKLVREHFWQRGSCLFRIEFCLLPPSNLTPASFLYLSDWCHVQPAPTHPNITSSESSKTSLIFNSNLEVSNFLDSKWTTDRAPLWFHELHLSDVFASRLIAAKVLRASPQKKPHKWSEEDSLCHCCHGFSWKVYFYVETTSVSSCKGIFAPQNLQWMAHQDISGIEQLKEKIIFIPARLLDKSSEVLELCVLRSEGLHLCLWIASGMPSNLLQIWPQGLVLFFFRLPRVACRSPPKKTRRSIWEVSEKSF